MNADAAEEKKPANAVLDEPHFIARVLEVVPSVVYVRDLRDHSHVFVNRRVADVIGYTPEEVIELRGDFMNTLWHPDDVIGLADYERELAKLADDATTEITAKKVEVETERDTAQWQLYRNHIAAETAQQVTSEALQLHGAAGYGRSLPLERMMRDARMFAIGGGTLEMMRNLIADRILPTRVSFRA